VGCETAPAATPGLQNAASHVLVDQTRHLRPAQARHFLDVTFHQTFAAPPQTGVVLRTQRLLRPLIQFRSIRSLESNFFVPGQKCLHLLQAQMFAVLHAD